MINILSGMRRGCLTIEIIGSAVLEGEERINLKINETSTMAIVEDRQTTVVIESDGSTYIVPVVRRKLKVEELYFACICTGPVEVFWL